MPFNTGKDVNNMSKRWLCAFFIVLVFAVSCTNAVNGGDRAYFDEVFRKIDAAAERNRGYQDADMSFLDSSFAAVKDAGIRDIARKYNRKIYYYRATKLDYEAARLYADSSINLLQNHLKDEELALLYVRSLFARGDIYFRVKNYDEAIRNYTIGKLTLSANVKDSCELYLYYESMASVLYAQKKYLLAARFYRLKYINARTCIKEPYPSFLAVQENMDNTGICYYKAGLTDSATYYYNATLDYINHNENRFAAAPKHDFQVERSVVYSNQA